MELKKRVERIQSDREITGQTREQILPTILNYTLITTITPTTVKVTDLRVLYFNNSVPITITNFTGGAEQQTISIRGDGQTTIQNNANIVTNTGADKLLTINKVYRFTLFKVSGTLKWLEDA